MKNEVTKTAPLRFGRKRCILFCRAHNNEAAERQMKKLTQYVYSPECQLVDSVMLIGVSSSSKKSQNAIDEILMRKDKLNDFDQLVVTEFSRLSRKGAGDAHFLMSVFIKHGIELVTLDYPIKTDDPCPYLELDLSSASPPMLIDRNFMKEGTTDLEDQAASPPARASVHSLDQKS